MSGAFRLREGRAPRAYDEALTFECAWSARYSRLRGWRGRSCGPGTCWVQAPLARDPEADLRAVTAECVGAKARLSDVGGDDERAGLGRRESAGGAEDSRCRESELPAASVGGWINVSARNLSVNRRRRPSATGATIGTTALAAVTTATGCLTLLHCAPLFGGEHVAHAQNHG